MSATLWLNTEAEKTVDLGGTLQLYQAFSAMAKATGQDYLQRWPGLFGVVSACEDQEDVPADWFAEVQQEAAAFREQHKGLPDNAQEVLQSLIDAPALPIGNAAHYAAPGQTFAIINKDGKFQVVKADTLVTVPGGIHDQYADAYRHWRGLEIPGEDVRQGGHYAKGEEKPGFWIGDVRLI